MSRSWDPWQLPGKQKTLIPKPVLEPSKEPPTYPAGNKDLGDDYDFISFLALAQSLDVDFLPVTWHPTVETLGAGVTAEVRQALVDVQTSFAFKRFGLDRQNTFRTMASEMQMLAHNRVRSHAKIVRLLGIGWDVNPDGPIIWPVLVFEKAPHGNLEEFVESEAARHMSTASLLRLLSDVASAICSLHSEGIVHCDVKPNNILVFRNEANDFTAKLADLGFASVADRGCRIKLATPESWSDPLYKGDYLDGKTARKMESFSFGLICVWLLRHACKTPKDFIKPACSLEDAQTVIERIQDLNIERRCNLGALLSLTLSPSLDDRGLDFDHFSELLQGKRCMKPKTGDLPESEHPFSREFDLLKVNTRSQKFDICQSLYRLLKGDFRLPSFIASQLMAVAEGSKEEEKVSNARFQLAFCHAIGFGVRLNKDRSARWLEMSGLSKGLLEEKIDQLRTVVNWPYKDDQITKLEAAGTLDLLDPRLLQDAKSVLSQVERHYRDEIEDYIQVVGDNHPIVVLATFRLGHVLNKAGKYEDALDTYRDLGKVMQRVDSWGPGHRSTWITWTQAAAVCFKLGRYSDAEEVYRKVLAVQYPSLGPLHADTLSTTDALAIVLQNQGRYEEADRCSREALETRTRVMGLEHPDTLSNMSNRATILQVMGKFLDACGLLEQCVSLRTKILGKDNGDTLICKGNLSALYALLGRFAEARAVAEEVIADMDRVLGATHPDSLYIVGNLASIMDSLDQGDRATELRNRLLDNKESIGIDNPFHLTFRSNQAVYLLEQGRLRESRDLSAEILLEQLGRLGVEHPGTLRTRHNIATVLHRQGNYQDAKIEYEATVQARSRVLGASHPATLDSRANFAYLFHESGDYASALSRYETIIDDYNNLPGFGSQHPVTLMAKSNLGVLHLDTGRSDLALSVFEETFSARLKTFGERHRLTLQSMDNLAVVWDRLGRKEDAEQYFRRELSYASAFQPDDLIILNARNNLGLLLADGDHLKEAESHLAAAFNGRQRVLGPSHPDTLISLSGLSTIDELTGNSNKAIERLDEVLKGFDKVLGKYHPRSILTAKTLARNLLNARRFPEAETRYRDLQHRAEERHGLDGSQSFEARLGLAKALYYQQDPKRMDTASVLLEGLIMEQDAALDANHVTCDALATAGLVQEELGNLPDAEAFNERALRAAKTVYGSDHRSTLNISVNLASTIYQRGEQLEVSLALLRHVAERRAATLGPDHLETVTGEEMLASNLFALGHDDEALQFCEHVRARYADTDGIDAATTKAAEVLLFMIKNALAEARNPGQEA